MEQTAIFGPFFATMFLTLAVWIYMYVRRIGYLRAARAGRREPQDLTALVLGAPPAVATPADNFRNLFEMPVLFYALALYLFATGRVDAVHVVSGWVFVVFRTLHSAVHCTFNLVMLRFYLYLVASLAVWLMLARAAMAQLGG